MAVEVDTHGSILSHGKLGGMNPYIFLALVLVVALGAIFWPSIRLGRVLSKPLPQAYKAILRSQIPVYDHLPESSRQQLHRLVKQFLHEKQFYGCEGLEITDEMRLTIAGEACLMLLNRNTGVYPKLRSILVYPTSFVAHHSVMDESGVMTQKAVGLLGESWGTGKVVLAWDNVQQGASNFTDGKNVVLHEFAHQLDSETGDANGAPVLMGQASYRSWASVLTKEFAELQRDARKRRRSLMDHYGATNPAEFFAVATETFFERPEEMAEHHRELFEELKGFYKTDPRKWVSL